MGETAVGHVNNQASTLRSIAKTIEVIYPSSADELRGIANQMDPPMQEVTDGVRRHEDIS